MGFVKLKHPIKKTWFVFKLQQTMSKTYRTKVIFLIKIILILVYFIFPCFEVFDWTFYSRYL